MPKLLRSVLCSFHAILVFALANTPESFLKTEDGVNFYPNENLAGGICAILLQILRGRAVRLITSPKKEFHQLNSLIWFYKSNSPL